MREVTDCLNSRNWRNTEQGANVPTSHKNSPHHCAQPAQFGLIAIIIIMEISAIRSKMKSKMESKSKMKSKRNEKQNERTT